MQFTVSVHRAPDYLLVDVEGEWILEDVLSMIDLVHERALRDAQNCALLNAVSIPRIPRDFDRFLVGVRVAEVLGPAGIKLAVLSNPKLITRFAENVAVNRGAAMKIFDNRALALEWLRNPTPILTQPSSYQLPDFVLARALEA